MAATMNPLATALWRGVGALYVFFLLTPLVLVVLFSFTDSGMANFPIEAVSLKWWHTMLGHRAFPGALQNSLIIGIIVGIVSAIVGTMAAMGLARLPVARASAAMAALCLPLMLPPLVLGVALLSFYVGIGMRLSLTTVILSHLLFTLPFVVLVVYARMRTFDYRVVESARDLGASPLKAFLTVTLPIVRPTVIGAALIAVALSVDDFIITFFTIGSGNTLPTFVWGMIRTTLTPAANAIGTLIIGMTVGSTLLALWLTRYRG
jgi:spermidine/putrescine transport system permease protein